MLSQYFKLIFSSDVHTGGSLFHDTASSIKRLKLTCYGFDYKFSVGKRNFLVCKKCSDNVFQRKVFRMFDNVCSGWTKGSIHVINVYTQNRSEKKHSKRVTTRNFPVETNDRKCFSDFLSSSSLCWSEPSAVATNKNA